MSIFLLIPFGTLSDRYGRRPMILYPMAIMFIGTVIRTFATDPNHLILASLVGGFAGGSYFPVLLSMIGDIAEPWERQEAISTLLLFSSIGMVLGPLIATFLLTQPQITLRNLYQITVIAEIGVIIYLTILVRETSPQIKMNVKSEALPQIKKLILQRSVQDLLITSFLYNFLLLHFHNIHSDIRSSYPESH